MKTFITSRDVEEDARAGRSEVLVDDDTVVTAEAEERAAQLGIKLTKAQGIARREEMSKQPVRVCVPAPTTGIPFPDLAPQEPRVRVIPRLDLLVSGGRVVVPGAGVLETDVWVTGGRVVGLAPGGPQDAGEVVDAAGRYVLPGVVDPHVHLGLFASLAEDLLSESRSALLGGVTTLGCYFGGESSHLPLLEELERLVREQSLVDVFPHLVIANRRHLAEIPQYVERGVTSFKVYMCGIPGLIPHVDDGFVLAVFRRCKQAARAGVVCVHAENASLVEWATEEVRKGGEPDLHGWAETHPDLAEEEAILRAATLGREAGVPIYVVHVSTARGIAAVRRARAQGGTLFAEVASPYLVLTSDSERGTAAKMVPPFHEQGDREALWTAVKDGTVTTLGTDNVTLSAEQKGLGKSMWEVMPGYPALATHLSTVLSEGVNGRELPITKLAELMCRAPAEVFGLYPRKGTLLPGSDADLVIVDLGRRRTVRAADLQSRADFALLEGRELQGWPSTVVKGGHTVVVEGKLRENLPAGRLLKR